VRQIDTSFRFSTPRFLEILHLLLPSDQPLSQYQYNIRSLGLLLAPTFGPFFHLPPIYIQSIYEQILVWWSLQVNRGFNAGVKAPTRYGEQQSIFRVLEHFLRTWFTSKHKLRGPAVPTSFDYYSLECNTYNLYFRSTIPVGREHQLGRVSPNFLENHDFLRILGAVYASWS